MILATLYILFSLAALLLIGIVLIQEGKGGGMGAAFGGVGGEAFGHGAGGINRLTTILAAVFMISSVVIALVGRGGSSLF
ncbi:MAG: preprotein translocase subunit SecG [Planctomycetota bacterium]